MLGKARLKDAVVRAVMKAFIEAFDVTEIIDLICSSSNGKAKWKRPDSKMNGPKANSNIGRIDDHFKRHQGKVVKSEELEVLLLDRRGVGERLAGDAATICSNVNYLNKYYGRNIKKVEVGVYMLVKPRR